MFSTEATQAALNSYFGAGVGPEAGEINGGVAGAAGVT